MSKTIKAVLDKVVIIELKREKSVGGLIIPDSVQEPQKFGVVDSIGEKVEAAVQEGDVVIFHPSGGMAMLVAGKIMRCLMEAEIYGILKDKEMIATLTPCEVKQKDLDKLDKAVKEAQEGDPQGGPQKGSRIVRV